jgi:hypothetical protein
LLCSHANGLDGELTTTHIKEILEVGPQEVNDEDIVEALLTKVVHLWYAGYAERREYHI